MKNQRKEGIRSRGEISDEEFFEAMRLLDQFLPEGKNRSALALNLLNKIHRDPDLYAQLFR